jgi:hypothetical protein
MDTNRSISLGKFDAPAAFPAAEYDAVNDSLAKYSQTTSGAWRSFSSAWIGIPYRWRAAHEHSQEFIDSIRRSSSPEENERYRQDHYLFVFVTSALSAFECFYFAAHCFGSIANSGAFPLAKARDLNFYPRDVAAKFESGARQGSCRLIYAAIG